MVWTIVVFCTCTALLRLILKYKTTWKLPDSYFPRYPFSSVTLDESMLSDSSSPWNSNVLWLIKLNCLNPHIDWWHLYVRWLTNESEHIFFDWLQAWWTTVRNHWTLGFSQHFQTKLPVCCRLGPLKKAERTLTKVELRPKGRPKSWVGRWFPFFEWIFGDFEVDYHQEFRKSMFFHVFSSFCSSIFFFSLVFQK